MLTNIILKKFNFFYSDLVWPLVIWIYLRKSFYLNKYRNYYFSWNCNMYLVYLNIRSFSSPPPIQICYLKNWESHHNCAQSYYVLFRHFHASGKWWRRVDLYAGSSYRNMVWNLKFLTFSFSAAIIHNIIHTKV